MRYDDHLRYEYEFETIDPLGRIGVIALATDFNIETDLRRLVPVGVEVLTNRVLNANPISLESLRAMAPDIARAGAGILPNVGVDAMIYACTSGTAAIGEENVEAAIHSVWPGIPVTNPLKSACAAFEALGAKRLSVLTPYVREVNETLVEELTRRGFEIVNIGSFNIDSDFDATRIPSDAIAAAGRDICDPSADVLFVSCTALRAAAVIERLEADLGKPVVCSNQALAWHALQLIGCAARPTGFGRLFDR